jgi:hypothetical protein
VLENTGFLRRPRTRSGVRRNDMFTLTLQVEDAADSRRQGCSRSNLLQTSIRQRLAGRVDSFNLVADLGLAQK